jgi:hypothetical protein
VIPRLLSNWNPICAIISNTQEGTAATAFAVPVLGLEDLLQQQLLNTETNLALLPHPHDWNNTS